MAREIVTSENRKEYMEKKLAKKADKKKPEDKQKAKPKSIPHGIWHSGTDKLHSHYPSEEEAYKVYNSFSNGSDYAMGQLTPQEKKQYKYE